MEAPSGSEFSTFLDIGYDFLCGNLSFGPVFAAQYTNVYIGSYTEQGSFLPLNIHDDSEEPWRTDLGIQASYSCHVGNIMVIPILWIVWEHEYKYSRLPINFQFGGLFGSFYDGFWPGRRHIARSTWVRVIVCSPRNKMEVAVHHGRLATSPLLTPTLKLITVASARESSNALQKAVGGNHVIRRPPNQKNRPCVF
jgi:Autotransporter beta-domain